MTQFPFLSVVALSPFVAAVIILMLPKERGENARMIALGTALLGLILSVYVRRLLVELTTERLAVAGYAGFRRGICLGSQLGIQLHVGVDGLSLTLGALTSIVGVGGVMISWSIDDRPRRFMAFFMLLVAGVQGRFCGSRRVLLFFFMSCRSTDVRHDCDLGLERTTRVCSDRS